MPSSTTTHPHVIPGHTTDTDNSTSTETSPSQHKHQHRSVSFKVSPPSLRSSTNDEGGSLGSPPDFSRESPTSRLAPSPARTAAALRTYRDYGIEQQRSPPRERSAGTRFPSLLRPTRSMFDISNISNGDANHHHVVNGSPNANGWQQHYSNGILKQSNNSPVSQNNGYRRTIDSSYNSNHAEVPVRNGTQAQQQYRTQTSTNGRHMAPGRYKLRRDTRTGEWQYYKELLDAPAQTMSLPRGYTQHHNKNNNNVSQRNGHYRHENGSNRSYHNHNSSNNYDHTAEMAKHVDACVQDGKRWLDQMLHAYQMVSNDTELTGSDRERLRSDMWHEIESVMSRLQQFHEHNNADVGTTNGNNNTTGGRSASQMYTGSGTSFASQSETAAQMRQILADALLDDKTVQAFSTLLVNRSQPQTPQQQ